MEIVMNHPYNYGCGGVDKFCTYLHTHTHNCMVLLFIMSSRLRYCGGPMWGRGIVVRRYSGQEDIIHPKSSCTCNESHLLKLFRLNSLFVFSVLIFFMKFIYEVFHLLNWINCFFFMLYFICSLPVRSTKSIWYSCCLDTEKYFLEWFIVYSD